MDKFTENIVHCVKSVFSGPVFSPNTEKYGPEKTPYLDTFQAVIKTNTTNLLILTQHENDRVLVKNL